MFTFSHPAKLSTIDLELDLECHTFPFHAIVLLWLWNFLKWFLRNFFTGRKDGIDKSPFRWFFALGLLEQTVAAINANLSTNRYQNLTFKVKNCQNLFRIMPNVLYAHTPPRAYRINGLTIQVLKPTFLA